MAGEGKVSLSIVLRTVDNATAGLKLVNKRIEDAFKPFSELKKQAGEFAENIGLPGLMSSFGNLRDLLGKIALGIGAIGGAAVLAFHKVMELVDQLDELGDTAQRIGISADALAQYRYAAEQAGAETGEIDSALEGFNKRLGELRRNQGQLNTLLKEVNPHFRDQLKHAKTAEEAFNLLANAVVKLDDPTKRAQLVTAAFGKSAGPGLIGLLSQGATGIDALKKRYFELAGSQEAGVESADGIKHAMTDAKASFDGVRNAIVVGLAPALLDLAQRGQKFFSENREAIAAWVKDFGEKLPARIQMVVNAFKEVVAVVKSVWDTIGGAKGAAIALVAVIGGKLLISIGSIVASLVRVVAALNAARGAAAAASAAAGAAGGAGGAAPGVGLAGRAGQAGAVLAAAGTGYAIGSFLEDKFKLSEKLDTDTAMSGREAGIFGGVQNPLQQASLMLGRRIANINQQRRSVGDLGPMAQGSGTIPTQKSEAKVKIEIAGAPKGTRVTTDPGSTADVDTVVGNQTEFAL